MLTRGTVFRYGDEQDSRYYRIVDITGNVASIISLSLDNQSSIEMPVQEVLSDLDSKEESGIITAVEDPWEESLRKVKLTEGKIEKRDRLWDVFGYYWNRPESRRALLDGKGRTKTLKEIAEKLDVSFMTAKRIFTNFLRRGATKIALTDFRGKPGAKRYKKCLDSMLQAYNKHYLTDRRLSLKDTYILFLRDNFSETYLNENGEEEYRLKDPDDIITYRQFLNAIRPYRDYEKEMTKREGAKTFKNNYSLNLGSPREEVFAPGSVYEIDLAILPVYVVTDTEDRLIVGRPSLYWSLDVATGMPTGLFISLKNESYYSTDMVVLDMATLKSVSCAMNGVVCDDEVWPARFLPEKIRGDNGKFHSRHISELHDFFETDVKFAEGYISKHKAIIEHQHNVLESLILKFLPGASEKNRSKSGRKLPDVKDGKSDASLTMAELKKVIYRAVKTLIQIPIETYPMTPDMIAAGIQPSPLELWNYLIKKDRSQVKALDEKKYELLKIKLLPKVDNETRVLTQNGVSYKNLTYIPKDSKSRSYTLNHLGDKFDFHFNPYLVDELFMDADNVIYVFELHPKFKSYRGMSFYELDAINKKKIENRKNNLARKLEKEMELTSNLEEAGKAARKNMEGRKAKLSDKEGMRELAEKVVTEEEKAKYRKTAEKPEVKSVSKPEEKKKSDPINDMRWNKLKGIIHENQDNG